MTRSLLLFLVSIACGAAGAAGADRAPWIARMDGLAESLTSLLVDAAAPDDATPSAIDEAARRERMKHGAATIRAIAHELTSPGMAPDADPTIAMLLAELDATIDDVDARVGRERPVARPADTESAALAVAWTCMGCHTRGSSGTHRPTNALAPLDGALPPDVRGVALAATRRFPQARAAFRAAVFDERFAQEEPTRWRRAIHGAVLLDVRVFDDPRAALEIVDAVLATPGGDPAWPEAAAWRRALRTLVDADRASAKAAARADSRGRAVHALAADAALWMDHAQARGDDARAFDVVDDEDAAGAAIYYLRATALLHELLMRGPPPAMRAEALSQLGIAYAGLASFDVWSLHLVYDAACVEAAPHTALAVECYERWRGAAADRFAGEGGVPPALAAQAVRLADLARP